MRRPPVELLVRKGWILILFVTPLFCLSPFSSSPLINEAHPSRLAEIHMLQERAFAQQGWISGWDQRFQCGYPVGIYQYQTGPLLIVALTALTSLPLAISYKIILYLTCLLTAFLIWGFLLRHVSTGVAMAGTMALMLGTGFIEQMSQGFWNCAISLGFLALFLDELYHEDHLDARRTARLMFFYALIVLTHQYAAIAAGVFMVGRLPAFLRKGDLKTLVWWGLIPIGAILATLAYTYPIIDTGKWLAPAENGSEISKEIIIYGILNLTSLEFISNLVTGQGIATTIKSFIVAWPNMVAEVLVLSLIIHWRTRRLSPREKQLVSGLLIALAIFVVINLKLLALIPSDHLRQIASKVVSYRFKIFSELTLFLLATLSLHHWNILYLHSDGHFWHRLRTRLHPRLAHSAIAIALGLTTLLAWYRLEHNGRDATLDDIPNLGGDLQATWQWFRQADRGPYRVLFESTMGNFPSRDNPEALALHQSTITAMSALYTGMPQIGGVYNAILPTHHYSRSTDDRLMGIRLTELDHKTLDHRLRTTNVGYLVTSSEPYNTFVKATPGMESQARFGPFTIYRYLNAPGNWAWSEAKDPVQFQFDPDNDGHMHASFTNAIPGNRLHVRVTWHPYWQATLNGQPLMLRADDDGMIEALIDKTGPIEVDYVFSSRNLPGPVLIFNALFLTGLIIWVVRGRFRPSRRRDGSPA